MEQTLKPEQFEALDDMIYKICLKKKRRYEDCKIDFDDAYQEAWVKALQVIDDCGGDVNLSLIASCIYNKIEDLCRYQFRRINQVPVDQADLENTPDGVYHGTMVAFNPDELETNISIEEIMNLFEKDSKEYEFVEMIAAKVGVVETKDELLEFFKGLEHSLRMEMAWALGYASSSSSGFRGVEWRVRCAVEDYLDECENDVPHSA